MKRVVLRQLLHHREPHLPRRGCLTCRRARCASAGRQRVAHPDAGDAPGHLLQRPADDAAQQLAVRQPAASARNRERLSHGGDLQSKREARTCAPRGSPQSPQTGCRPSSAACRASCQNTTQAWEAARARARLHAVPSAFQPDTLPVTPRNILSATCVIGSISGLCIPRATVAGGTRLGHGLRGVAEVGAAPLRRADASAGGCRARAAQSAPRPSWRSTRRPGACRCCSRWRRSTEPRCQRTSRHDARQCARTACPAARSRPPRTPRCRSSAARRGPRGATRQRAVRVCSLLVLRLASPGAALARASGGTRAWRTSAPYVSVNSSAFCAQQGSASHQQRRRRSDTAAKRMHARCAPTAHHFLHRRPGGGARRQARQVGVRAALVHRGARGAHPAPPLGAGALA